MTDTKPWPGPITAITLFADDLAATRQFYLDVFDLPLVFEDQASAVFRFGDTLVNLLSTANAPELVAPAMVAGPDAGPRSVLTVEVDDVDAKCDELRDRGVELLNGPMDRPWGVRTASFRDPAGHIWEIGA
jgi:catechol 2,3-dioxygenase-like lactoylglutathione lyase family enzyme